MNMEEWQEISRYNSDAEAEGVVWLNGMSLKWSGSLLKNQR